MSTVTEVLAGDHVDYIDQFGRSHNALVTQVWNSGTEFPSVNLVFVSNDDSEVDQYGRQIKREASVVHESNQAAHGRYWRDQA